MFGNYFRRRRFNKMMADLETTFLSTFGYLKAAASDSVSPVREIEMGGALAALVGSLRDVYPDIPIEEKSLAIALINANANSMIDAVSLSDAISKLVLQCPDRDENKMDLIYLMIAPESASQAQSHR